MKLGQLHNLGIAYWKEQHLDAALACYDQVLKQVPVAIEPWSNRGLVLSDMDRCDEAEASFARALELKPGACYAIFGRGAMRLSLGDYERGWPDYEYRIPLRGPDIYPQFGAPYWNGEDIKGKSVFCYVEGGIGDTIMFSRWLPWLKQQVGQDGIVYLFGSPERLALLPEMERTGIVSFIPESERFPECSYTIPIGSLPYHQHCTLGTLPADPGLILRYAKTQMIAALSPEQYKVGLCWTGNNGVPHNKERTIPLELMLELANPRISLYSLQVGYGESDIDRLRVSSDILRNFGPWFKRGGLRAAAAAILQMDLVITCDTSIAHIAGALGVPAWVVLCKNPYWVWMRHRSDSPWYPSVRLFRQTEEREWVTVMRSVRDELWGVNGR